MGEIGVAELEREKLAYLCVFWVMSRLIGVGWQEWDVETCALVLLRSVGISDVLRRKRTPCFEA